MAYGGQSRVAQANPGMVRTQQMVGSKNPNTMPMPKSPATPNDPNSLPVAPSPFGNTAMTPRNPFAWANPYANMWAQQPAYNPSQPSYGIIPGLQPQPMSAPVPSTAPSIPGMTPAPSTGGGGGYPNYGAPGGQGQAMFMRTRPIA